MAYDAARQRTVLFGGSRTGFGSHLADTWEWNGKNWVQIKPATSPPARWLHGMAYDSARGRTVMFGGIFHQSPTKFADTWEYIGPSLSTFTSFGKGCAATTTPTALSATTLPRIGTTFTLSVSNLQPFYPGLLLFGFSNSTWNGVPLPLDLSFLGMNGCNLLVSWDLQVAFYAGPSGGTWDLPLPLPNDPTLAGLTFYNQAWVLDPKANAFGVGTSNGGKGVIGY